MQLEANEQDMGFLMRLIAEHRRRRTMLMGFAQVRHTACRQQGKTATQSILCFPDH